MRIFLATAEVSASQIGAALARELFKAAPGVCLSGLGSPALAAAGVRVWDDPTPTATIGYLERWTRHFAVRRVVRRTLARFLAAPPDLLVCIDSPQVNLPLAEAAARRGIPVVWYVPPQEYFWGSAGRARRIAGACRLVITIDRPGRDHYRALGARTLFAGHPLLDELARLPRAARRDPRLVLLFLGSRAQELARIAPVVLDAARLLAARDPSLRFVAPVGHERFRDRAAALVAAAGVKVDLVPGGRSRELLSRAAVVLTKAGTSTLEAMLLRCPMVLLYRVHWLTYLIATRVVRIQDRIAFIGLPNLYSGRAVVPELVQSAATAANLADAAAAVLAEGPAVSRRLGQAARALGRPGASARAARAVLDEARRVQ